jgi:hypothetical protein
MDYGQFSVGRADSLKLQKTAAGARKDDRCTTDLATDMLVSSVHFFRAIGPGRVANLSTRLVTRPIFLRLLAACPNTADQP